MKNWRNLSVRWGAGTVGAGVGTVGTRAGTSSVRASCTAMPDGRGFDASVYAIVPLGVEPSHPKSLVLISGMGVPGDGDPCDAEGDADVRPSSL